MGRIARLASVIGISGYLGRTIPAAVCDPGGSPSVTCELYRPAGDDSKPLPDDYGHTAETEATGVYSLIGYVDVNNDSKTSPGESRKYARDPSGAEVSELWQKSDGTVILSNGAAEVILKPTGEVNASNSSGSVVLQPGGDVVSTGSGGSTLTVGSGLTAGSATGSMSLADSGAFEVTNGSGSFILEAGGAFKVNGQTVAAINSSDDITPGVVNRFYTTEFEIERRIIVKAASDICDKTLLPGVEYFIDGEVDCGSGSIRVPEGGLNLKGLNSSISKLYTSEDSHTLFVIDPAGGYSGALFMGGLTVSVTGSGSSVFACDNDGNFSAAVFNSVNFEDCSSLGYLDSYRQFLTIDVGIFGCSDGLEFRGTWFSGARVELSITTGTASGGTVFKAGAGLLFQGRFKTDMRAIIPSGATFCDFSPSNFANDGDFQLKEVSFSGSGTYLPNISSSSVKSYFTDCSGIRNTYVGAEWQSTTESTTNITSPGVFTLVAGTTLYTDEAWFLSTSNNEFKYISDKPIDITVSVDVAFSGSNNDTVQLKVRKWDASANVYVDLGSPTRGTTDSDNISFSRVASIEADDTISIWVANTTASRNVTMRTGSYAKISER